MNVFMNSGREIVFFKFRKNVLIFYEIFFGSWHSFILSYCFVIKLQTLKQSVVFKMSAFNSVVYLLNLNYLSI